MSFNTSVYLFSTTLLSLCHATFLRLRGPEGNYAFNIMFKKKNPLQLGHKYFEANICVLSIKLQFHRKMSIEFSSIRDEKLIEKLPIPTLFLNALGQKPSGGISRGNGHL